MKDQGGNRSLAALIALKVVCCGGLLLATGVLSAGGLMAFFDNPVVQVAGVVLVAVAVWALVRRRAARGSTVSGPRRLDRADASGGAESVQPDAEAPVRSRPRAG